VIAVFVIGKIIKMEEQLEIVSVRGLKEGTLSKIDAKASAAGASREAWLRKQIESLADEPIIKERYGYRVYGKSGKGVLKRLSNHPNGVQSGFSNFSQEEADAYKRAQDYISRNGPGDREEAVFLLKSAFDEVFEIPV
jgi:hypothetical protein